MLVILNEDGEPIETAEYSIKLIVKAKGYKTLNMDLTSSNKINMIVVMDKNIKLLIK